MNRNRFSKMERITTHEAYEYIAGGAGRDQTLSARILPMGQSRIFQLAMRDASTWIHLKQLMKQTHLPIIVKGVLHPADALTIKNMGCAGIILSNRSGKFCLIWIRPFKT